LQEIINTVVIDNDSDDIIGISTALASEGISSIPILFKDPTVARDHCRKSAKASPRIIITDIQMVGGGKVPDSTDLNNVAGCLEEIVGNTDGPYIILAWTAKPNSLKSLKEVVLKLFKKKNIREPLYFDGISKEDCQGENGYEAALILEKFTAHLKDKIELRVLMNWEKSVISAANNTVNALIGIPCTKISNTLGALGEVVAGKNLPGNESVAVNEAISNILRDEISQNNISSSSSELWSEAVKSPAEELDDAGKHALNSLIHFDQKPTQSTICPGDVWTCKNWEALFERMAFTSEASGQVQKFKDRILKLPEKPPKLVKILKDAKTDEDRRKAQDKIDKVYKPYNDAFDKIQMAMMEISPACDFANNKKSLKSLALGWIVPTEVLGGGLNILASGDLLKCKTTHNDQEVLFVISAKYLMSLSSKILTAKKQKLGLTKVFRMRESMLHSWVQSITGYNARIGTMSFD